jgi:hypothetical protein
LHGALDCLANTQVVVKDGRGRFDWVSANMQAHHAYCVTELRGFTETDTIPKELAALFHEDDVIVLRTENPILERTAIAFDEMGPLD